MAKSSTSLRISDEARSLLAAMARASQVTQTTMLEIIIREAADKRGIKPPAQPQE